MTGSRKVLNSIPRVSVRLGGSGVNRTQNHPVAPALAENDDRWSLVLRVAASRQFTKAPQLHDMLLYICQRALTDPAASIKEHEIGCNALGRKADFNPNEDNIVRVQVSNLRKKLEEYFATDGKDEPMRITVPKGAYVPRFEPNVVAATPAAAPVKFPWILLLWVSTGLLAISCLYLVALRSPAPHNAPQATTPQTPPTIHFGPGFSAAVSQRRWWLPIPVWSCFRTSSTRTFPWPTISAIGTRKNSSTR